VPAELVTVSVFTPVALFVTTTLAPGTTAPEGSVTVPVMPLRAWAYKPDGEDKRKRPRVRQASK